MSKTEPPFLGSILYGTRKQKKAGQEAYCVLLLLPNRPSVVRVLVDYLYVTLIESISIRGGNSYQLRCRFSDCILIEISFIRIILKSGLFSCSIVTHKPCRWHKDCISFESLRAWSLVIIAFISFAS